MDYLRKFQAHRMVKRVEFESSCIEREKGWQQIGVIGDHGIGDLV